MGLEFNRYTQGLGLSDNEGFRNQRVPFACLYSKDLMV